MTGKVGIVTQRLGHAADVCERIWRQDAGDSANRRSRCATTCQLGDGPDLVEHTAPGKRRPDRSRRVELRRQCLRQIERRCVQVQGVLHGDGSSLAGEGEVLCRVVKCGGVHLQRRLDGGSRSAISVATPFARSSDADWMRSMSFIAAAAASPAMVRFFAASSAEEPMFSDRLARRRRSSCCRAAFSKGAMLSSSWSRIISCARSIAGSRSFARASFSVPRTSRALNPCRFDFAIMSTAM